MKISLSPEEVAALKDGLDSYLPELERETVRADVHSIQHALNMRWEYLTHVRERLDEAEIDQDVGDSESPMLDEASSYAGA